MMEYLAPVCALITIAVSIPMILRKIPPNYFYGVRTRKTLSDPKIWYEANYLGGLALTLSSLAFLFVWLFLMAFFDRDTATIIAMFCWIAFTAAGTVYCLVQIRKL